jgi:hypothetical protein
MNTRSNLKLASDSGLVGMVLAYENAEFIERLKVKLVLSHKEAEQLFLDMKQFLYMCGTRPGICSPTDPIDAAWHEFVLYTEDYANFCQNMFGRFIHHVPPTYLSGKGRTKGKTWRTYQVALDIFGELSSNWEVPEHMRPNLGAKSSNVALLEFDNCGDSCGCGPACNSD